VQGGERSAERRSGRWRVEGGGVEEWRVEEWRVEGWRVEEWRGLALEEEALARLCNTLKEG